MMNTYMDRTARGELRWALTLYPTNAYAQDADMSLDEYADFVYSACMPTRTTRWDTGAAFLNGRSASSNG